MVDEDRGDNEFYYVCIHSTIVTSHNIHPVETCDADFEARPERKYNALMKFEHILGWTSSGTWKMCVILPTTSSAVDSKSDDPLICLTIFHHGPQTVHRNRQAAHWTCL